MYRFLVKRETKQITPPPEPEKKKKKYSSYKLQHVIPTPKRFIGINKNLKLPEGSNPDLVLTDDLKKDLKEQGYCVVPQVFSTEECKEYINLFWDWLVNLGSGIVKEDWSTWTSNKRPLQDRGIVKYPSLAHADFIWKCRTHPNIRSIFSQLWQDNDLLVGFCRACILPPSSSGYYSDTGTRNWDWFHTDQSSRRRGLHCVQGSMNLIDSEDNDGGFVVIPGSHLYHDEFFKIHDIGVSQDWYKYSKTDLEWFYKTKGLKIKKVNVPAGALILWDSRLIHCNHPLNPRQLDKNRYRMCIYVCYTPRSWATEEILKKKQEAFNDIKQTRHWPHLVLAGDNGVPFDTRGVDVSVFKNIQTKPPILDEIGMRLAGF